MLRSPAVLQPRPGEPSARLGLAGEKSGGRLESRVLPRCSELFLRCGRSLFLTGSQSHRPASPPFVNWQEPLFPLTSLSNALQQNSAADLSMLVLESLEKAEVEVANELLGEAARAPPCVRRRTHT